MFLSFMRALSSVSRTVVSTLSMALTLVEMDRVTNREAKNGRGGKARRRNEKPGRGGMDCQPCDQQGAVLATKRRRLLLPD